MRCFRPAVWGVLGLVLALTGCGPEPKAPLPKHTGLWADEIPVAHTPPGWGGWGKTFPPGVLRNCTEPLAPGAPDLRGIWKIVYIQRGGKPLPKTDDMYKYAERIEQCGNRIVDEGHGQIADARADGTFENAVHEVSAFDYKTPILAVASYEDGWFILRPAPITWLHVLLPFYKVTRHLDSKGFLIWTRPDFGGQYAVLKRIGGPKDTYTIH